MAGIVKNLNALKNGMRITRLVIGELPSKLNSVKIQTRKYRNGLEASVIEIKGGINVVDAHLVDTAATAMLHAGVCRWLLRDRIEKMQSADILKCSAELLRSKEVRDKSVRLLKLDERQRIEKSIDALYGPPEEEEGESDRGEGW